MGVVLIAVAAIAILFGMRLSDPDRRLLNEFRKMGHVTGTPPSTIILHCAPESLLSELHRLPTVTTLEVWETGISDDSIAALSDAVQLESLSIVGCEGTLTVAAAERLASMPRLRKLKLGGCGVDDDFAEGLSESKTLEDLSLSYSQMTRTGVIRLSEKLPLIRLHLTVDKLSDADQAAVPIPKTLRILSVPGSGDALARNAANSESLEEIWNWRGMLTDDGLAALAACKNLKRLWIPNCKVALATPLPVDSFKQLQFLELDECPLEKDSLSNLGLLPELRVLSIFRHSLGKRDMKWLERLPKLETLVVRGGGCLDDDRMPSIAKLSNLKRLVLGGCAITTITDRSMPVIASLPNLEYLSIDSIDLTDVGVLALRDAKKLNRINLPYVSAAALSRLASTVRRPIKVDSKDEKFDLEAVD
jgi:Leucine-rich repeat (LRR) protein